MTIRTATCIAASAAAVLLMMPAQLSAQPHGSGLHGLHYGRHFRGHLRGHFRGSNRRGYYGFWPWYGGYAEVPPIDYGNGVSFATPPTVVYVAEPPQALSCHRSQQTVTVPDEAGGTHKIMVTRC